MTTNRDAHAPGQRGPEAQRADRTLGHDAETDREYTTGRRAAALDRESPTGAPSPAPGDDPSERATDAYGTPGARGPDLDEARELASRDLDEETAVRRAAQDAAPPRRR